MLLGFCLLGKRANSRFWRRIALITSLVSSVGLGVLVYASNAGIVAQSDSYFASAVFAGIAYASTLCVWMQAAFPRTARDAMISTAGALLVAGVAALPIVLMAVDVAVMATPLSVVLPVLFSGLFFAAFELGEKEGTADCSIEGSASVVHGRDANGRLLHRSSTAAYALIIGFATTQFFFSTNTDAVVSQTIHMGSFVAVGVIFLFVVFVSRRLDVGLCFSVVGMVLCLAVFFSLFLDQPGDLLVMVASVLHWSCFLLLVSTAFESVSSRCPSIARAALLLAAFFLASISGALVSMLVPNSRMVCGIVAIVLLVVTLVFARGFKSGEATALADGQTRNELLHNRAIQAGLTPRETDVYLLLVEGNSLKRIAEELYVSENTLKTHRTNIYQKMGVESRQELLDQAKLLR